MIALKFRSRRRVLVGLLLASGLCLCMGSPMSVADETPAFFRGLNLNGEAVVIDGHAWEGRDAKSYVCDDNAFESQQIALAPATDDARARMIRSSRWGGNRIELLDVPAGTYTVFLYVWEDNNAETYTVSVNGRTVLQNHNSGSAGQWEKLGPWYTESKDDAIVITSRGGAANFSGIEIWRGRHDGVDEHFDEEQLAFFEKRIRPLLIERCYECHSEEAGAAEGELLVDSRPTIRRGGGGGPAVVAGNLEASLLVKAIRYDDESLQMPPDEKLSDEEIADLERWVEMGAPDPRSSATVFRGKAIDIEKAREHWSLRPLMRPTVPTVPDSDWAGNAIDHFILAKQVEQGLSPIEEADRRALIRRVTYDLIGLPPTPDEVQQFVQDRSPAAYERLVDRLLASPEYGQRWGRHWLDVVRYADTAGDNSDYPIPQAYRYRDWVIRSLNRDLPYDEFVRDQLAGDLRPSESLVETHQRIIATGYIAGARRFGSRVDDYPQHLTIEDTIDNLGRAFLGLTLSCARCHDHKFDPVTTRDYYAIYGIFHSTRYPWPGIELDKRQRDLVPLVRSEDRVDAERTIADLKKLIKRVESEIAKLEKEANGAKETEKAKLESRVAERKREVEEIFSKLESYDLVYAVADSETIEDVAVHMKGEPTRLGEIEPRHFLTVLGGQTLKDPEGSSGRLELADWLLDDDNPLTSRVIANRLWQFHFGRGIVSTANDFGKQGKPPTHPELLDYLACELRDSGWSLKSLHRKILTSRTFRQSSMRSTDAVLKDPTNELLSGFPRRRLDAESIRDTILVLGDSLDRSPGTAHPFPEESKWGFTQHNPFKAIYDTPHRSVYMMTQRIQRHPYLAIFDGADPSTSTPTRTTSTTPLQALYLLNDSLVHAQATRIASKVREDRADLTDQVQWTYELLFSRPANNAEVMAATRYLARAMDLLQSENLETKQAEDAAWASYVRSLLRLNEFVYLD